jgi:hypothetical protein
MMKHSNPARVAADLERRRSNAARPIPSKKVARQGSRSSAKRAAVRDYR